MGYHCGKQTRWLRSRNCTRQREEGRTTGAEGAPRRCQRWVCQVLMGGWGCKIWSLAESWVHPSRGHCEYDIPNVKTEVSSMFIQGRNTTMMCKWHEKISTQGQDRTEPTTALTLCPSFTSLWHRSVPKELEASSTHTVAKWRKLLNVRRPQARDPARFLEALGYPLRKRFALCSMRHVHSLFVNLQRRCDESTNQPRSLPTRPGFHT